MPVATAGSAAVLGPDGKIYVIGGAAAGVPTNLRDPTAWVQVESLMPTNRTFTFTDTNLGHLPKRFYRVLAP